MMGPAPVLAGGDHEMVNEPFPERTVTFVGFVGLLEQPHCAGELTIMNEEKAIEMAIASLGGLATSSETRLRSYRH